MRKKNFFFAHSNVIKHISCCFFNYFSRLSWLYRCFDYYCLCLMHEKWHLNFLGLWTSTDITRALFSIFHQVSVQENVFSAEYFVYRTRYDNFSIFSTWHLPTSWTSFVTFLFFVNQTYLSHFVFLAFFFSCLSSLRFTAKIIMNSEFFLRNKSRVSIPPCFQQAFNWTFDSATYGTEVAWRTKKHSSLKTKFIDDEFQAVLFSQYCWVLGKHT